MTDDSRKDSAAPAAPEAATMVEQGEGAPGEDHPIYQPPAGAEESDQLDAAVDGTSASHYGANDPALYEDANGKKDR